MDCQLQSGSLTAHIRVAESVRIAGDVQASSNALTRSLDEPLGLPEISNCVVPGDRVTIAVDQDTPLLADVTAEVCRRLLAQGTELDITVLLPTDISQPAKTELSGVIADSTENRVSVHIHDPRDEQQRRYLASSAAGDRIYLSEHLVDCDLLVTIGVAEFDSVLGCRGTNSILYPAFSDTETLHRSLEARCSDDNSASERFSRETIDEIGWLLGTQFAVQVIPSADRMIADVVCGAADQVQAESERLLRQNWQFDLDRPHDLAVLTVATGDAGNCWQQLGGALESVKDVVASGGRIAVVCDPAADDAGPALEMLRRCTDPEDLLKPLRLEPTTDAVEIIQLAEALQRTRIFLRSSLPTEFVEDLGILPLESDAELQRLIDSAQHPLIAHAANHARFRTATTARCSD